MTIKTRRREYIAGEVEVCKAILMEVLGEEIKLNSPVYPQIDESLSGARFSEARDPQ